MRPFILAMGMLASIHAQADTIAEVFNKAWLRLPQTQSQLFREAELQANQTAAASLLPAPPAIGLGHRSDRLNRNAGGREYEIDISFPLWLPGEKAARQLLAASQSSRFTAEQAARRLQLAGELREAIWQARLAESVNALLETRLSNARQIEADVARRVKAGDLARTDLLLAQQNTMSAQSALVGASRELAAAMQAYRRLVGDDILPVAMGEPPAAAFDIQAHPLLVTQRHHVEVAQAQARLVSQTARDNPELSVGTRRERGDFNERFSNTVAVSVRIPLGTTSRNAPRAAAAQADLIESEVEYQRLKFAIEQTVQKAQGDITLAKQQLNLAQSRQALALENLQLIKKSFSLGEKSLFEFQRNQAALNEAALANSQAKIALYLAYARFNQAMGVLP